METATIHEAEPSFYTRIGQTPQFDHTRDHFPFDIPIGDARRTKLLATSSREYVEALGNGEYENIINLERINNIRHLNKYFEAVNRKLPDGGMFVGCGETTDQRKERILRKYPKNTAHIYYVLDWVFKRVFPKLIVTRRIYFALTKGRNRVLSKSEILGRLVSCGFEIIEHAEMNNLLYFVTRKEQSPRYDLNPSYGPLFKMERIGWKGKPVEVYKFRTMYPFSEYLQSYIYQQNRLESNGKLKNDFRVTTWGKFMRRTWLDETPMIINWIRGDLKLVGVRPLSKQYLSLYPKHMLEKRFKVKPGLIPPFYADLPQGFDEIVQSEEAYLDAYEQRPFRTDCRYFGKALFNIVCRRARSQ